jgi:hypothetical protein
MRTLATLQDADSGTATLGDIDVLGDKDAVRRQLGYLPQDFGVYPKVSAVDLLDHLARLKGIEDRGTRRTPSIRCCARSTCTTCGARRSAGSRGGCASASASRRRCSAIRASSSSTSRRPASIPRSACRFHNLLAEIGEKRHRDSSTHIVSDVSTCARAWRSHAAGAAARRARDADAALDGRVWQGVARERLERKARFR